ncbi:MAG: hexose kinase [Deinococcales bacterium]
MTRATTRAIVALTPNPALDRTLWLDRALEPGALHRVQRVREAAGGKGVNLARAVAALGGSPVVAGPVAGFNGRKFRALLQREGIAGALTEVAGETRECTIVLGGAGHPTEINEAGPDVDEDAWRELLAALPEGRLVVAGSLPPGIAPSAFGELLAALPDPLTVDAHGPALVAALEAGAELVKPNRRELGEVAQLLGLGPDGHDPLDTAVELRRRYGVRVLATLGEEGALLVAEQRWRAHAPRVEATNPIGSGDCLLGAFLWAEETGEPPERALALAVAAGADNARRGGGGTVDGEAVRSLATAVRTERLA